MSLLSLKKSTPSVELKNMTVDEFIEEAQYYACGLKLVATDQTPSTEPEPLKRATFTLGKSAIAKLNALSKQTGLAKSKLIRLWLDNQTTR